MKYLLHRIYHIFGCSGGRRTPHYSDTDLLEHHGIYFFDDMLKFFYSSFRSRVTASHNQLIFGLCTAHCSVYSKLWAWQNNLLHKII